MLEYLLYEAANSADIDDEDDNDNINANDNKANTPNTPNAHAPEQPHQKDELLGSAPNSRGGSPADAPEIDPLPSNLPVIEFDLDDEHDYADDYDFHADEY